MCSHSRILPIIYYFYFFLQCSGDPRDLHSFPTRRSSDLGSTREARRAGRKPANAATPIMTDAVTTMVKGSVDLRPYRSEEHTSELQSHSDLVCRLLLEKKKQKQRKNNKRERHKKSNKTTE